MVIVIDHAAGESLVDQVFQRLRWPLRIGESVGIPSEVNLVCFDTLVFSAGSLHPHRLSLFARLAVTQVPRVVFVTCWKMAQEKHIKRFRRQHQTEPLDFPARQKLERDVLIDQMQRVALLTFDWYVYEAQLG